MPANFLIVCGGAGRGILSRFDDLGFDGALQIDVQDRLVQSWDGRVQTFELPVSQAIETPPNSLNSLFAYERRLDNEWKEHHIQNDHKGDYKECGEEDCQNYQRQVKHVATAIQGVVPTAISNGMSQNPIIGRSYITRPLVSAALSNYISQMSQLRPANQPEVTVWIVASTCGGTGNGIVHHVADLVKQVFGDTTLKLKFIRIGALSYQSISRLTTVSTFWSVLTDYGYMQRHKKHIIKLAENGVTYHTTKEFYYIDVPDVGFNVLYREALVRSAFVAISNPTIDKEFVIRLNSCGGVFMARVGEWGYEFNRDSVYFLTLRQLSQKLQYLLSPQSAVVQTESQYITITVPNDLSGQEMQERYGSVAKTQSMQPVLTGLNNISPANFSSNNIGTVVQFQGNAYWSTMQQVLGQLFDATLQRKLMQQVQVTLTINGQQEPVSLGSTQDSLGPLYIGSGNYIDRLRMAQRAKAKIQHYLFGDADTLGYIVTTLRDSWNALIPKAPGGITWFVGDEERQKTFIAGIVKFIQAYFTVAKCLELHAEAEQIIQQAVSDFRDVKDTVERQIQQSANEAIPHQSTTTCAELDETFGGAETWLQRLRSALQGNLDAAVNSGEFRRLIEMGTNGLTEEGLKYMLQLPAEATTQQMVDKVNRTDGNNGAVWWQGMQRPNMWDRPMANYWLDFRIFPKLPYQLMADMTHLSSVWATNNQQAAPRYVPLNSPALGLKVYAVQGAAVAPMGNESLEIQQLVGMIIPSLSPQTPWYIDNARGEFSLTKFRMVQCTHSIGLPVRIPAALLEDPHLGLKEIVDALADCVTFDMC